MAVDDQGRKVRRFSGEGSTVTSLILLIGALATILISFYLFAHHDNWLFLLGIGVYGVALLVPTAIMSSRTVQHSAGGLDTVMDGPPTNHTNVSAPSGH